MSTNGVLVGNFFISGDIACAEGAISAGCRFFGGYPITPATEIAERMAERMSQVDGTYIQMEDEIASMAAILGASWGGAKSMTATSGPGFSLMMENIGLALMTETPCVVVDVQRAGPSTGLPTMVAQGDVMQARWGTHGSYEIIALSPSSPQEFFHLTVRAFNLSERYRVPVIILSDEVVGHMTEKVTIPPFDELDLWARKKPSVAQDKYQPYAADADLVPPMAIAGEGYHAHITGLTHDERGYPTMTAEAHQKLVQRLVDKIRLNADEIIEVEETDIEDADVVVCAYGITARVALLPIQIAREEGIKVGLLRLITVWPFPEKRVREIAGKVKAMVVPELNAGQIVLEVERCAGGQARVLSVPHMGGDIHQPQHILDAIRKGAK